MKQYQVVLCALAPRDARMIEQILARTPFPRMSFKVVSRYDDAGPEPLAVADSSDPASLGEARALGARLPRLPLIHLTDQSATDPRRYCIQRRRIWSQLVPTLESVVQAEILGDASHRLLDDDSTATGAAAAAGGPRLAAGLHALVVDDSAPVRTQMEAALLQLGLQVTLATQAKEARALLQAGRFDLMFLDVVMPGIDGYAFCRELRTYPALRALPVIMLTGQSSLFDRTRGALAGCDVYLTKPIQLEKLRTTVEEIAARRSSAAGAGALQLLPQTQGR